MQAFTFDLWPLFGTRTIILFIREKVLWPTKKVRLFTVLGIYYFEKLCSQVRAGPSKSRKDNLVRRELCTTRTHVYIGLIEFDIIKVSWQCAPSVPSPFSPFPLEIITDSGVPLHSCLRYTCIRSYLLVQIYSFVSKRRKISSGKEARAEERRDRRRRTCDDGGR